MLPFLSVVFGPLGMTIPTWALGLVSNGLLVLGSFWIARYLFGQMRGISLFLGTALVFWASATVALELFGPLGAISPGPIMVFGVCWLALGGFARRRFGRSGSARIDRSPQSRFSAASMIGLGLVLSAALIVGLRSLLLAVKVVSDGPIYHLYFAVRWWKAGRLFLVAAPFGENAASYFPVNGELWFTWLMASWGGDRLARVGQVPFLVLAGVAAFGCARALQASRSASLIATCWFVSSTPLLLFSLEPNVDTIFVAGYLIATYFFLRALHENEGQAALVLGALAAGLALGTKAVAVVFVPPLLALAAASILYGRLPARTKIAQIATVILCPLFTGGYSYLHNAILTGNPLYPLEVRILGRTLLAGWYAPDAMRSSPYYFPVANWRALVDTLFAVLDPRMVPLWVLALVGAWAIKNAKLGGARRWVVALSLLAIVNVALYWLFIPYRSQQRFMLQALGLAAIPLALLLDRARWLSILAVILLALHLLTPQYWPFKGSGSSIPWDFCELVPNAIDGPIPLFPRLLVIEMEHASLGSIASAIQLAVVLLASMFAAWACCRLGSRSSRSVRGVAIALTATAAFVVVVWLDVWSFARVAPFGLYPPFADFYLGWQRLEAASGRSGSRVAYAGTNIPYYLFGKGLRNEVSYVNIDRHRDWLMHDYHREAMAQGRGTWPDPRPGWDRIDADYPAWVANLEAAGIQLLVVTRVNPAEGRHNVADRDGFPIERIWADAHPDRFAVLYGHAENDPWFRLYRVRMPARSRR